jgi:hypothetical protein
MEKVIKERPILFSAPVVRAILDGTKTMTRRVVKPQPISLAGSPVFVDKNHPTSPPCSFVNDVSYLCPYGVPGDRLWVRESVSVHMGMMGEVAVHYYADDAEIVHPRGGSITAPGLHVDLSNGKEKYANDKKRPSIHMPRWASRILLEVTAVRVERLRDIGEEDARAEGVTPSLVGPPESEKHRFAFRDLWFSINGPDSWNANPWVWVVEFKRITEGRKP